MAYTKLLTIREVYASIYQASVIEEFFRKGLELNNDRLAISAVEELIQRGDSDIIADALNEAFKKGQVEKGGTLVTLLARVLKDECRELDPIMVQYGKGLLDGDFMSPSEWVRAHLNELQNLRPYAQKKIKPWATDELKRSNGFDRVLDDLQLELSELH